MARSRRARGRRRTTGKAGRCPRGYSKTKGYTRKDGKRVSAYCRKRRGAAGTKGFVCIGKSGEFVKKNKARTGCAYKSARKISY